jgi:hypothetical protein
MLCSQYLLSLPSNLAVASNALGFVLPSFRLGGAVFFQTAGRVCMQGKQKTNL